MAETLASLLLGSTHPDVTKAWYRAAFGVNENDAGALDFGSIWLFIEEHSEITGPAKEPARTIINFNVDDCRGCAERLDTLGTKWHRAVEQEPFGLIGTALDPDGNYVQIIQWGASPEDHKS